MFPLYFDLIETRNREQNFVIFRPTGSHSRTESKEFEMHAGNISKVWRRRERERERGRGIVCVRWRERERLYERKIKSERVGL